MTASAGDKKIKIAFFDEAVAFGGSVVVLAHLLNYIDRTRFKPLVVTSLDEQSVKQLFRKEDVLCWFQPKLHYASRARWMSRCPGSSPFIRRIWAYLFTLAGYTLNFPAYAHLFYCIARARPDIVHYNNGYDGLLISKMFKIPLVWHLHGVSDDSYAKVKAAGQESAPLVSIARFISEELTKQGADPAKLVDIPNPVPMFVPSKLGRTEWRARYGISHDAVVLAHVGRVVRWKGQLEFLQAFAQITADCPNAVALIVGDDVEGLSSEYPVSLRQLVAEKGLDQRVIFTGHVSSILELMSFTEIVVHSSIEPEPFGLVITEAMVAGAAVIAARLGAPIEIIEDGVTGLLVDPCNTAEFAAALKALITDESRRKKIAVAGKQMAEHRYSPKTFAARMEDVYRAVLADHATASHLSKTSSH